MNHGNNGEGDVGTKTRTLKRGAEFTGVGHVVQPNKIPHPVPVGPLGSRAVAPRALRRVHRLGGLVWSSRGKLPQKHAKAARPGTGDGGYAAVTVIQSPWKRSIHC